VRPKFFSPDVARTSLVLPHFFHLADEGLPKILFNPAQPQPALPPLPFLLLVTVSSSLSSFNSPTYLQSHPIICADLSDQHTEQANVLLSIISPAAFLKILLATHIHNGVCLSIFINPSCALQSLQLCRCFCLPNNFFCSKEKDHINVVVIGHVDSGKSTTTGHLIYKVCFTFCYCFPVFVALTSI
jgi:hypothetical protein